VRRALHRRKLDRIVGVYALGAFLLVGAPFNPFLGRWPLFDVITRLVYAKRCAAEAPRFARDTFLGVLSAFCACNWGLNAFPWGISVRGRDGVHELLHCWYTIMIVAWCIGGARVGWDGCSKDCKLCKETGRK